MENFANLDPRWVDVYWDPGREYSIPWQWGTTAFMVDTETYDGDIDTLAMLFDPPEPLQGEVNMLRDVNDVLGLVFENGDDHFKTVLEWGDRALDKP